MWRAVLNVQRSWLSREIASFGAFGAAACASFIWPEAWGLGELAAALGIVTLFCIDRVYDLVRTGARVHSADTFLTGALIATLALAWWQLVSLVLVLKLLLYVLRWRRETADPRARGLRIASLVGALTLIGLGSHWGSTWVWLLVALGESIDRAQFYQGLVVPSPRRQMVADLASRADASSSS
jgi:DMSO reductase anchor subunit